LIGGDWFGRELFGKGDVCKNPRFNCRFIFWLCLGNWCLRWFMFMRYDL